MFSKEELKSLDRKYFAVIVADEYDVTVMSRNTGHYWYGRADTLRQAVRSIQEHDRWKMNGKMVYEIRT